MAVEDEVNELLDEDYDEKDEEEDKNATAAGDAEDAEGADDVSEIETKERIGLWRAPPPSEF